jgi:RNA polymerase sigma-70 factor, ECF subfamily
VVPSTEVIPEHSDWDCLRRALKGSGADWQRLIERHHPRLVAQLLLLTGCPDSAKDLAQEAFLRLLHANLSHERGTVQGLLSTIAYRLAFKEKARRKRNLSLDGVDLPDPAASPLSALIRNERDLYLAEIVRSLDTEHREVLVLRFYGGHSYEEIAALMEIPLGTVKSRIFNAVKTCRERLRKVGIIE